MATKRLTPKQRVLKIDASAYSWQSADGWTWYIDCTGISTLGYGDTPRQAWAAAAANIKRGKK